MVSKLKNLFLIIVIILFSVIYVKADSNNSDLTIQNIEIIDKADTMDSSVELNPISNISTNSSFFEEGDYVKYKITIKNNSNNKYQIKELLDNNDQTYINNTYEYSKKEINQNEEYSFNMITSYNNLISTKKEIINTPLIISLKYSNQSSNPNTIDTIYIYHLIFLISLLLFTFFMKMSKKQRATLIIGLCILNIPFLVKASGNVFNLELYRDIHIYKDTAIFVTGKEFNKKIKSLASNNQNITYNSEDNLISRIVVASEKNTELTENNIISSEKTNLPIYAWYEERTIYLWSEDNNPELNPNSSCMFQKLNNVKNISLNDFDSSNIKDSSYMFLDDKSIETIRIENLETKKVTNMESMFEGCEKIKNIDCTSFNTEKVNNMKDMFKNCNQLEKVYISDKFTVKDNNTSNLDVFTKYENQKAKDRLLLNLTDYNDGLYEDITESGRFNYRGTNPDNYIMINNERWRILSVMPNNTIKVIGPGFTGYLFDNVNARPKADNSYCAYTSASWSCDAWAANRNLVGNPEKYFNKEVNADATLNTYLNTEYLQSLPEKEYVVNGDFSVGCPGYRTSEDDITTIVNKEKEYIWNGKVGLLQLTEFLRGSLNSDCKTILSAYDAGNNSCSVKNWISSENVSAYTLNSMTAIGRYMYVYSQRGIGFDGPASQGRLVRPIIYLSSNIKLSGMGTYEKPFEIVK